jgi:hypothetical protein
VEAAGSGKIKLVHLFHQLNNSRVGNFIIYEVGIFSKINNSLIAKNVKMLGNIGAGGVKLIAEFSD